MKKGLPILVLMAALLLLGCAQQAEQTEEKAQIKLVEPGYLTVGSDIAYPPFEYTDEKTGEYTGFDIDLMKEIAKRMGLEAKFVNTAWMVSFLAAGPQV